MPTQSRRRTNAVTAEAIAERRAEILDHTADLIVEAGVAGCTFAAVSERSGFSIGMIQHYFRTRDRLVDACIDHRLNVSEEQRKAIVARPGTPLERLRDLLDYAAGGDFASGWGFWLELFNASRLDDSLRERVNERLLLWRQIFHDTLADVGETTRSTRSLDDVVASLLALADGLAIQVINGTYGMTAERMRDLLAAFLADQFGLPSDLPNGCQGA